MTRPKVQAGGILRKSTDQTWRTPRLLREAAQRYYAGVSWLDVCAPPDNPLGATRFFCGPDPAQVPSAGPLFGEPEEQPGNDLDGLREPWSLPWWCNPPFRSVELRAWLGKVVHEADLVPEQEGLLLLPFNRVEEAWVQEARARSCRELLIRWPTGRGRVPFESSVDVGEARTRSERREIEVRWLEAFGALGSSYRVEVMR